MLAQRGKRTNPSAANLPSRHASMPNRMHSNPGTFDRSGFQSAKRGTRTSAIKPKYLASARNAAHFRPSLRALVTHDRKHLHGTAISLDGPLTEPGHPDIAADLFR